MPNPDSQARGPEARRASALTRLLRYVARVPLGYTLGALLTIAYATGFQFVPLATGAVVESLYSRAPLPEVGAAVRALIGVAAIVALLRLGSRVVIFRAARQIEYSIRGDLLRQLQTLSQRYFSTRRTGDLMSRAVNDLNAIRLFLGLGILNIVQTPVLVFGAFGVMLGSDWVITVTVVLPYLVFVAFVRMLAIRIRPASLDVQDQLGELSALAQENAAGVSVVRSYGMEAGESERFERANQELYGRQMRLARYQLSVQPAVMLLPALALVLLLYVGGTRVQSGALTLEEFTIFHTYLAMLTQPTMMMGWVIVLAQRGLASLSRVGQVLDEVSEIRDAPGVQPLPRIAGGVRARGLAYAYEPGGAPALAGVDFEIESGQTLGIVGAVGSGKTTLVSALPRLIEVERGQLWIDGVDICDVPLEQLRASTAMVPQDSFLFSTSIARNIAFGLPELDMERVREAARRAHVLAEIEDLPHGFDTEVGERGITLSGGQRQRISLARALVLEPSILILDDALSSVDAVAEESILAELRAARAGRTCFIVAHRLSAVRDADSILVLDAGRVVEQGTHESLVRAGGPYAQLWRRQQLEAELAGDDAVEPPLQSAAGAGAQRRAGQRA